MFQRILVATDFTPNSDPALAHARQLAKASGGHLWIAHVYDPAIRPEVGALPVEVFEELETKLAEGTRERLEPLVDQAREAGVDAEALVLEGFPDIALVEAADRLRCDLIAMGTHGRRGAARFFLGSVAARVVAAAHCPVLTVRSS